MAGGLPDRYSAWVLHDTTTATWGVRHVAQAAARMTVPIALVLVLVPGPFWIRAMQLWAGSCSA